MLSDEEVARRSEELLQRLGVPLPSAVPQAYMEAVRRSGPNFIVERIEKPSPRSRARVPPPTGDEDVLRMPTPPDAPRMFADARPVRRFAMSPRESSELPAPKSQRRRQPQRQQTIMLPKAEGDDDYQMGTGGDVLPDIVKAAATFRQRHQVLSQAATEAFTQVSNPRRFEGCRRLTSFNESLDAIRRNRFVVNETAPLFLELDAMQRHGQREEPAPVKMRRTRYDPNNSSVWASRRLTSNSKDFYETTAALRRMFEADWDVARRAHNLERLVIKSSARAGGSRSSTSAGSRASETNDLVVEELKEVLFASRRVIYGSFDHYAISSEGGNETSWTMGDVDLFNVSLNNYLNFIRDNKMVSQNNPRTVFELIFTQVDAPDENTSHIDIHNKVRCLNRQEWIQVLVRVAIAKYITTGKTRDVANAVDRLLRVDLIETLPPPALQNSNGCV
jgi:hypothetical protein